MTADPRPTPFAPAPRTDPDGPRLPVLIVDDLSKTYADGTEALSGIGLSVRQG